MVSKVDLQFSKSQGKILVWLWDEEFLGSKEDWSQEVSSMFIVFRSSVQVAVVSSSIPQHNLYLLVVFWQVDVMSLSKQAYSPTSVPSCQVPLAAANGKQLWRNNGVFKLGSNHACMSIRPLIYELVIV